MSGGRTANKARRQIVKLINHGATDPTVSTGVIDGQLTTAAALRERLDAQGGAILGDEVGAGKTYVAMALLVQALAENPRKGAVILVPKPALLSKWEQDLRLYLRLAVRDQALSRRLLDSLSVVRRDLAPQSRNAIVIAQQNLFMGRISDYACASVLRAHMRERSGRKRRVYRPWLRACGITGAPASEVWNFPWTEPEVFHRDPELLEPLDEFFEAYDARQRLDPDQVRGAIGQIRRSVARRHLPDSALLIIDEAHHLRNTSTTRYVTMREVVEKRFDALLFLTATPFQMGPSEMKSVLEFSRSARLATKEEEGQPSFDVQVTRLIAAMESHVHSLAVFGRAWSELDSVEAVQTQELVAGLLDHEDASPQVADVVRMLAAANETKARVEALMSPFIVRSVRDHHRETRKGLLNGTVIEPTSRIPLALVDRMLYEVFEEGGRTFIASALLGACSSWEALWASSIMSPDQESGTASRAHLRQLESSFGKHPKFEATVTTVLKGIARREKVLIFVERKETGRALADRLALELRRTDESSSAKERGRRIFQDRDRRGWPALRENYLHTVFPLVFGKVARKKGLKSLARRHLDLFRRLDASVSRGTRDYSLEKRFWEHILFREEVERQPAWARNVAEPELVETARRILDEDYILNGLDLQSGESKQPKRPKARQPSDREPQMDFASAFVGYESPWVGSRQSLARVPPDVRAQFVEQAASAIARSQLRFEFLELDFEGVPTTFFESIESLLKGQEWAYRFRSLSEQLEGATRKGESSEDDDSDAVAERVKVLIAGLQSTKRVIYVDGDTDAVTRDNASSGFKTPMYPDVLIATDVLGEGVDLHRHCREVIHHDLPWNPAKLEQRTGRVDRIGSYSEYLIRQGRSGAEADILVNLPYVPGTYDAFIYSRVIARERVFKWLLGHRPEWDNESLSADEAPPEMPDEWIDDLTIDLAPA